MIARSRRACGASREFQAESCRALRPRVTPNFKPGGSASYARSRTVLHLDHDHDIGHGRTHPESGGNVRFWSGTLLASDLSAMRVADVLRSDLFRFVAGLLLLSTAALTKMAAPTELLWKVSIAATEGGHWLAIAALLPALPRSGQKVLGKLGSLLSLGAFALFALPLYQAQQLNRELPGRLDASFGAERRERAKFAEDARAEPFVPTEFSRRSGRVPFVSKSACSTRPTARSSRWISSVPATCTVRCPACS